MLYLVDVVTGFLDAGLCADILYLDIAKTFDTIPHDKLLSCLIDYDLNAQCFKWVKALLYGRKQ